MSDYHFPKTERPKACTPLDCRRDSEYRRDKACRKETVDEKTESDYEKSETDDEKTESDYEKSETDDEM